MARVTRMVLACAALFLVIGALPPHHAFEALASYLPLHTMLETVSIVVAALIFGVIWNAHSGERAGSIVALGCAFLAVALIDFAHVLSYRGMPEFVTPAGAEKAIFFWLAARLVAAFGLLAMAFAPRAPLRTPRARYALLAAAGALAGVVYAVGLYRLDALPHTFIEGQGLTGAKVAAEVLIIALLAAPMPVFYRQARLGAQEPALLLGAAAVSVLSELAFTLYTEVTDAFNLLGHVYKVIAYVLIYRAVFVASVRAPFERLAEHEHGIRRLTRVHAVLSGINAAIVRIRDRSELLEEACRIAVEAGGFVMAWAGTVDRAGGRVRPVGMYGDDVRGFLEVAPLAILETAPGGQGLAGRAVREASPVFSNDVAADPQRLMKAECAERGINSLVVLPLVVGAEVAGVLALYAAERGFFDDEEMRLLRELAGDVAFALDHIEKEERVRYLAYYDALTGLANRTLFLERLAQHLANAAREGRRLALVIVNIERFKTINDTLGRPAGDALLKMFAERLQHAAHDASLVARVGADQFAALLLDVKSDENLVSRLERGEAQVQAEPFVLAGRELRIATRAGVAVLPQDAADAESLFRNAEAAQKQAQTGERYVFYKQEMTARVADKLSLENELRRALEKGEFVLHYQPKLELATRRFTGAEALIRWASPQRGLVPPGEFIPLLEETGLIVPVGAWAMAQAVADHQRWQRLGLRALRVAVNVSAIQLRQREFVSALRDAVKEGAAPPGIDLEITESVLMQDVAANIEKLRAVHELGVNIAIDDFGTGYSSLGYLAKLPAQALKIDRSFVAGMAQDGDTMTLVSTIVSLGHALRLRVIAEGVENEDQARYLRLLRCDEAQGFLYSRPLPAPELEALLEKLVR
jgi:diguanylate cyclase (GGDEF)-like protein